jgi:hypothetical protein
MFDVSTSVIGSTHLMCMGEQQKAGRTVCELLSAKL